MTPTQRGRASIKQGAATIRARLIAALDHSFCEGDLGKVLWQDSDSIILQMHGIDTFQAIQLALFPQEFLNREELEAMETRRGMVAKNIAQRIHPGQTARLIRELDKLKR